MSGSTNCVEGTTSDILTCEKSSRHKKEKKNKKENRVKNINVPVSFNSLPFREIYREEDQITKVLDYSENDFPVLGTRSKKPSNRVKNNTIHADKEAKNNSIANPSASQNEKLPKKVLRSNKHKEAFKVNFDEIISNISNKSSPIKHKIRPVKHFKEDLSLGRNPLDSDNPIRKKGVVSTKPKPKRISSTKAMVYEAREEMQRLKSISQQIAVKNGKIEATCDTPFSELWKPLYLFKAKDLRECLKEAQKEINHENDVTTGDDADQREFDENFMSDEATIDSDSEQGTLNCTAVSLEEVLESSEIPPYKLLIHSNNFKRYCDNCVTSELNEAVEKLINQLVRYQYKKYQIDPLKAAAKKRYVLGLRQVKKYVKMNKIKLIVFVPNMEESLCDTVEELKSLASAYCIPYLFAFSRKKLGRIAYKKIGVSCLGILDYSGAEENFKSSIEMLTRAKKMYVEKCSIAQNHCEPLLSGEAISPNQPSMVQNENEEINEQFSLKLSLED